MKERYTSKVVVFLILTRIQNGKKEVLLQERCNTGYMDGKYDVAVSGHLENGETLTQALVREAKEEISIDIEEKDLELVSVIHPFQENYLNIFFTTKKYNGIPKIMEPEKCNDLNWFDINNLPENTIERIKNVFKNIQSNILYDDGDFSHQKLKDNTER